MNDINIIMDIISSMTNERAKQIVSFNTNIKKRTIRRYRRYYKSN